MRSWSATYPARGTSASAASDGEPASHARPINVGSRDFLNITTPCREWRGSRDESCRVAHAPLPADPLQSVCHPAGTKPAGTRSSRRCRRPRNRGTRDVALLNPLIVLALILVGVLPTWPYSASWGYAPMSIVGVVVVLLLLALATGRI